MKKITQNELDVIIANHQHWLNKDCEGWQGMRADLSDCELFNLNFDNADLRNAKARNVEFYIDCDNADFSGADLFGSYFSAVITNSKFNNADLSNTTHRCAIYEHCDFSSADCSYSDFDGRTLSDSNFTGTDFSGATLDNAHFNGCNVSGADFREASLYKTDFTEAVARKANFRKAILERTIFNQADLTGAKLEECKWNPRQTVGINLKDTILVDKDLENVCGMLDF